LTAVDILLTAVDSLFTSTARTRGIGQTCLQGNSFLNLGLCSCKMSQISLCWLSSSLLSLGKLILLLKVLLLKLLL